MSGQPDAGVVDEDVEPAEPLHRLAYGTRGIGRVPDISAHRQDRVRGERRRRGIEVLLLAPGDGNPGPTPDERAGNRQPDPARTSGDDRDGRGQSRWGVHLGARTHAH